MERGWRWLRGRSAVELAALAAGLAVFGYVGWDSALWDPRLQLLLHLLAVGAILALAMAALRGSGAATHADRPAAARPGGLPRARHGARPSTLA